MFKSLIKRQDKKPVFKTCQEPATSRQFAKKLFSCRRNYFTRARGGRVSKFPAFAPA